MKSTHYLDLLRGRTQDLPAVRSKVVRVFLSSTFTDTLVERDSLIENVFPQLKDYCRQKYGLEFQYADMRWGIQTESVNNHGEVSTCLKEIQLCKKYSVATNFVVLLSHRYGSRPIPAKISQKLFECLHSTFTDEELEEKQLLDQWYKIDNNSLPASYILQDISSILPNFLSQDPSEVKLADKQWKKINSRLRSSLRRAAKISLQNEQISQAECDDFFVSVTEKEIIDGILEHKDANERTLCFLREIVNIREHLHEEKAGKFIDLETSGPDGSVKINEEAENLLNRLKNVRIPSKLRSQNIFKYRVQWGQNGINREEHQEYIEEFNKEFYGAVKDQIDRCVKSRFSTSGMNTLENEVLEHAIQCKSYVAKFHGRIDVLSELEKYVCDPQDSSPCIVYGHSGCGKTSVLAKAATEVFKWCENKSVSVVLRFLGTTPSSSSIYKTLLSISEQICEIYRLKMTVYPTTNQLRDQLVLQLLSQIPDDEYLLILLDSIDQLNTDAYDCKWLPLQLPSNVKWIVSTLPDHGNILRVLKIMFAGSMNLFVEVAPFQPETVQLVYSDWLRMKNRSLSAEQRIFITNLMQDRRQIIPLFMKLVFDIISEWHSYDTIDPALKNLKNVDDCIRYLFHRLEVVHHKTLFGRALGYMTACRSGISQNELEDILSLDDDVLKSVFQHYIPPVRRIPGILWTRIRNDLDEYITEKEVDDAPVIYWYHRRFIEVARELYISDLDDIQKKVVFQNVVDFFNETWKDKDKPFKIEDEKLLKKYQLNSSQGELTANRYTSSQPVEFIDSEGRIQYNKRKLNELPQFLSKLQSEISIRIAAEEIFFNYSFMHAKLATSPFMDVQHDFEVFNDASSYRSSPEVQMIQNEMKFLNMVYMLFGLILNNYPDNYAFEITSRLLAFNHKNTNMNKLIRECDAESPRHCALLVPYLQLQPPGDGLVYSMNKHTNAVVDFDFVCGQKAAISLSNKIVVIKMSTGNTVIDINLPKINERYLNSTTMPKMIVHSQEKTAHNSDDSEASNSDSDSDSDSDGDMDDDLIKDFVFLVNSEHHIYLVSAHGEVKLHKSSQVGYSHIEVLNSQRGLCMLREKDSTTIECWRVGKDELYCKLDLPSILTIKNIIKTKWRNIPIVVIVFTNGTLHFYVVRLAQFQLVAKIDAGVHLDLVVINGYQCICTYDATVPIDFAQINLLNLFNGIQDKNIGHILPKTLISFNPPIDHRPFKNIIVTESALKWNVDRSSNMNFYFIAQTNEAIYVIHECISNHLSYVRIPGSFDIVAVGEKYPMDIYTTQSGVVNIYKWKCSPGDTDVGDAHNGFHRYLLFVSIDISSSPILTMKLAREFSGLFLCSMENGGINAYHSYVARQSLKRVKPFPRTTQNIARILLSGEQAVTLDKEGKELTSWTYKHSTSIDSSKNLLSSTSRIVDFCVLEDRLVAVITDLFWLEIYLMNVGSAESIYRFHLRCAARILPFEKQTLLVLTSDNVLRCINQQKIGKRIKYSEVSSTKLDISCTKLLVSVFTLNSKRSLAIFHDDGQSLIVWTKDNIISMKIDLGKYGTSPLTSVISEHDKGIILLHFENKNLVSCQLTLSQSNSYNLTSYDTADIYDLKNNCLVMVSSNEQRLDIHDMLSSSCHEPLDLENQCLHLCLNESGTYAFALVFPRILLMYRVADRRRIARLFVYDLVNDMIASDQFIVLAMNDRRLLTLMIADPEDSALPSKIQALPSRNMDEAGSDMAKKRMDEIQNTMNMSSDEYGGAFSSDDEDNDPSKITSPIIKSSMPKDSYRFVRRFNGQHSLTKMKNTDEQREVFHELTVNKSKDFTVSEEYIDDSDEEYMENDSQVSTTTVHHSDSDHKLDDIREKALEHTRQQIKGIQLANAGSSNLRIVNSHSITSATCLLM